jgi:lipoate-protein ligase A
MNHPQETWRFINSGFQDGRTNMAVDEALATTFADGGIKPTLRVYRWKPYTISLGFHQSIEDIDLDLCCADGIGVVFRPTGGRAILHAEELTYSVVVPKSGAFYKSEIMSVYEIISRGILAALRELNIRVEFEGAQKTPKDFARGELSTLCYASSIRHEIGFQGKKMVGSAQRRYEHAALQHGSILIGERHLDLAKYISRGDDAWKQAVRDYMRRHTLCINQLSTQPVEYEQLAAAMKIGFQKALGVRLIDGELSSAERQKVSEIKSCASFSLSHFSNSVLAT